jgi:hypothetical protein
MLAELLEEVMLVGAGIRLLSLAGTLFTVSAAGVPVFEIPDSLAAEQAVAVTRHVGAG